MKVRPRARGLLSTVPTAELKFWIDSTDRRADNAPSGKGNRQARNPMHCRKISLFTFAVYHDGSQDRKRKARRANSLFGRGSGFSISVVWHRRVVFAQFTIRKRAGLRGNRRDENQMIGTVAERGIAASAAVA